MFSSAQECRDCILLKFLQHIHIGIIILDNTTKEQVFVNDHTYKLLDIPPNEFSYDKLLELLGISHQELSNMTNLSTQRSIRISNKWIGFRIYKLLGKYSSFLLTDISEKKLLEGMAEALNTAENLGYVFMSVRHEIGNPVNTIKTALNLLHENVDEMPPAQVREVVDTMLQEVGRIERLLKTFKSYSLYDSIRPVNIHLRTFINEFVSVISVALERKNINYNVMFEAEDKEISISIDPEATWQILLNLISNAADAVTNVPNPTIEIIVEESEQYVLIKIKDNGEGISRENIEDVFRPFFTTKKHGTGLGLPISRKLAARMGGLLEIQSTPNKGTTAILRLPLPNISNRQL